MSIVHALSQFARQTPDALALVGVSASGAPHSLSYQALNQQVQQVKAQLEALAPSCIALSAENSLDWVVVDLAAMAANIACVPMPTFFTAEQQRHAIASAGVDLIIGHIPSEEDDWTAIDTICGYACAMRRQAPNHQRLPGTTKVTFTSGSTGTPKGVCLSQEQLDNVAQSLATAINLPLKKHLTMLPLSTLLENITAVYVPLLLGATSYIYSGAEVGLIGSSRFDACLFASKLAQIQPHSLVLTPALLMALIQLTQHQPKLAHSLTFVAVGGARVAPELIEQAHQLGIPAYEGYGLSECASVVCLNTPQAHKAGSCGQVLSHVKLRIDDQQQIWLQGNTALGYIGEAFDNDWYPTGDLGAIDEQGFVTIIGRKKNQIITSFGRNISPEWVETAAQRWLLGTPIVVIGEGQPYLSAIIASDDDVSDAVHQLNQTLPDYARIGRILSGAQFMTQRQLFTSNGRPIRALIEHWAQTPSDFMTITHISRDNSQANVCSANLAPSNLASSNHASSNLEERHMRFFDTLKTQTQSAQLQMLSAPIFTACQNGEISRQMYIDFLTQAFHHVKHTVPLLMACGSRLPLQYEWLRAAIGEYISEEQGHHEWILNDLRACGANTELVRDNQKQGRVSSAIELMVAYLYHQIDRGNPLALFGMVWVLEGTSVGVGGTMAKLVQQHLQLPNEAMSYLTSHSVLDGDHIQFFERLMNQVTDPSDQRAIIESANMVFALYGQMLHGLTADNTRFAA